MSRIAGLLLVVAGDYLVYYWARLHFGNTATVADDPIVSFAIRFSGHIRTFADGRGSTLVVAAGGVVLIALLNALLRRRRQTTSLEFPRFHGQGLIRRLALRVGRGC
jgi:hypothetical protein